MDEKDSSKYNPTKKKTMGLCHQHGLPMNQAA